MHKSLGKKPVLSQLELHALVGNSPDVNDKIAMGDFILLEHET